MMANLMSHELGEIAYLSLIRSFELAATPKKGISTKLSVLSDALKAMNLPDYKDAEEFLIHNRINYNLSPEEDKKCRLASGCLYRECLCACTYQRLFKCGTRCHG